MQWILILSLIFILLLSCIIGSFINRMHMEPLTTTELVDYYPGIYTKKYDLIGDTLVSGNTLPINGNI